MGHLTSFFSFVFLLFLIFLCPCFLLAVFFSVCVCVCVCLSVSLFLFLSTLKYISRSIPTPPAFSLPSRPPQSLRSACHSLPSLSQRSSLLIHTSSSPSVAEAQPEVIQPEHWISQGADDWTGEEPLQNDDPEMWAIIQKVGRW